MDLGNISKKVADAYTVGSSVVLTPTGSVVRTDHDKFLLVVDVGEDEFRLAVEKGFFEPKGHLGDVAMMYVQNAGLKCDALRPFEKKYFE